MVLKAKVRKAKLLDLDCRAIDAGAESGSRCALRQGPYYRKRILRFAAGRIFRLLYLLKLG